MGTTNNQSKPKEKDQIKAAEKPAQKQKASGTPKAEKDQVKPAKQKPQAPAIPLKSVSGKAEKKKDQPKKAKETAQGQHAAEKTNQKKDALKPAKQKAQTIPLKPVSGKSEKQKDTLKKAMQETSTHTMSGIANKIGNTGKDKPVDSKVKDMGKDALKRKDAESPQKTDSQKEKVRGANLSIGRVQQTSQEKPVGGSAARTKEPKRFSSLQGMLNTAKRAGREKIGNAAKDLIQTSGRDDGKEDR